jgi:hypothetical protein
VIERVISGGQTGADQAGWRMAKKLGIVTGGWMPRGFRAEDGNHPEFAALYGAQETESRDYPERTRRNARDSDVTLWFGDPTSRGGKLTLRCTGEQGHPYLIIDRDVPRYAWSAAKVARWLIDPRNEFTAVNVAGNRESTHPGIGQSTENYLWAVFMLVQGYVNLDAVEGLP